MIRHPPHVHARVAHGHIARQEWTYLLVQIPGLHAHHVRKLVPHLVHDMVRHMAVEAQSPGVVGDRSMCAFAGPDQHSRFRPLRRQRDIFTVGCRDAMMLPVDVDRMVVPWRPGCPDGSELYRRFCTHQGASRRKDLPFIVRMLKSDISGC